MNRPVTLVGLILTILAGIFYFLDVIPQAAIPLFVLGVIVALLGLFTGR